MPVPTPEERERRRQALQGKRAPAIPVTPPPAGRREQIKERQVASELQEAEIEAEGAEDELFSAILSEVKRENMLLTPAAAREEARKRLAERRGGPYYVGGFKPVEFPTAVGGALPAARPQEFPVAPDKPVTMAEALAPQTRAGVRAVDKVKREQTASIFDDKVFNESIKALPDADKREQLDAYEAYKAAFKKIRDLNPLETTGVTDEDIKRDLDRQLKALSTGDVKTFVDDPANRMGYSGDPLARALQRQVTTGAPVPVLEPGQTEFVSTLDRLKRSRATSTAAAEAEERLKKQGVPIMKKVRKPTGERGPGGRPIFEEVDVPTGQYRPATPEDIKRARENVAAFTDKEMPKPLYAETGKIDQFLSANEKASKGGIIFQKKFPTGATVESPVSWFTRAAMAVPNALVGAASELTPEAIEKRERAGRPALYKDASAAIYNVAGSRGLMGEIGDLYEYAPESWTIGEFFTLPSVPALGFQGSDPIFVGKPLKQYTTYAKVAGFAGDLIGFDLGLIGAVTTGARGAAAGSRAARAAGEGIGAAAAAGGKGFALNATKEFLDTIGFSSAAKGIKLGDVRLQFGTALGDSMRAGEAYADVLRRGGTNDDALRAAEAVAPKSKFVDDARRSPDTFFDSTDVKRYFDDAAKEYDEVVKVADAERRIRSAVAGDDLRDAYATLRPYIAAGVRETPGLSAALLGRADTTVASRLKLPEIFDEVSKLAPDAQDTFFSTVKQTASAEKGFTAVDRSVGKFDPGRFNIRLTPNTFATDDTVDGILQAVRDTNEYAFVKGITSKGVDANGMYLVDRAIRRDLIRNLQVQTASGTFPRSQLQRVIQDVQKGVVSGEDLRTFMNAVVDTVAAKSGGYAERALAPSGKVEVAKAGIRRGELPVGSQRPLTAGQTAGVFNAYWQKTADTLSSLFMGPSNLSRLLSPQQVRIIEEGKRKLGGLRIILENELAKFKTLTPEEKIIELVGDVNDIDTWRRIARSSVFGRSDVSIGDMLLGNFQYKDPFQFLNSDGRRALEDLITAQAERGQPLRIIDGNSPQLNDFIEGVRSIISRDDYVVKSFIDGGGVVFDLKAKPVEVLAGAWARREVDNIVNDTIARVIDYEPDTLGTLTYFLRSVFGDMRTADGRLVADLPINAGVAHSLRGGVLPTNLLDLKGMDEYVKAIEQLPAYRNAPNQATKDVIKAAFIDALENNGFRTNVDDTVALLRTKYGGDPNLIAAEAKALYEGRATISELGGPLGTVLGKAIRDDFGKGADFQAFSKELGILAELESKGGSGAVRARNMLTSALDTYNSIFYNAILSYNLRYHGTNFITGPFIGHSTTGMGIPNLFAGAKVLGRGTDEAARGMVITTDRVTGVPITLGEIYDRTVKSGAFKSQARAQLDPRFLDDARKLGLASGIIKGEQTARALVSLPSDIANASDNVWRMSYVVDALRQGKSFDEAVDIGRRSLYDYGAVTDWERKYVAKNILFYNFFRNSLLETGRQALTSPARLARQARLVQDFSKLRVGEEKWNEMRWYTPYDAGVARIVLDFAPKAGREGSITLFPNLPWYDAVYIMSGILTTPSDLLMGTADPVTGKREYGTGYLYNKISPAGQAAISMVTGADMLADVRLKKGFAPVQHIAIADEIGMLPAMVNMFNMKKRPAEPGETGWNGYVYTMEPEDFESYKTWLKKAKLAGIQRPIDDYGKWFATWDFAGTPRDLVTGPAEQVTMTAAEAMGITTETRAGVPAEAEIKAAQTRARQAKEEQKTATPTREELKARRPQ